MTRIELAKKIANKSGIATDAVTLVLTLAIEEIRHAVNNGEEVTLRTSGTFYRHNQPQKTARNISKNYATTLPPCFTPEFKPATTWREHLKKNSK